MRIAAGGIPSSSYNFQLKTALRWVEWIKEAVQNRKIAVLEEGGLTMAWKCAYCQTLNEPKQEKCLHCGAPRRKYTPETKTETAALKITANKQPTGTIIGHGSWQCPQCLRVNSPKAKFCTKCGAEKKGREGEQDEN